MKHLCILKVLLILTIYPLKGQEQYDKTGDVVVIETSLGDMEVLLYEDTPLHRNNMLELASDGYYDDLIFHRIINNFMIQGGDPHSKGAPRGQRLGTGGPGYKIPAEFKDHHFHKKGALAAARQGDNVNPKKESSGSQFYLVQGQVFNTDQLKMMQSSGHHEPFTPEQIKTYTTVGGTPHLDGSYTVFGEVISGMEVLDRIAAVKTDNYDRPLEDIVFSIRIKE